ncbi:Acyl-CoA dehydrogenase [Planctomycetes bacterium CA13]|uniref:Acyl-CoA dehydrogenase n=1 Tax=Novipirellula herctigrandis TaxID=2527986 RepID=A0A5C5YVC0_9BACT|nr:Acyl-CoA dehydrogenase [Planctomycetes bacterium CA13]
MATLKPEKGNESFAEVALRLGGASRDEAHRTGVVDSADDQVEAMFDAKYQTINSPVHCAVWEKRIRTESFEVQPMPQNESVSRVVAQSLEIVRKHRDEGTLLGTDGKIAGTVLAELGSVGYWGLLVEPTFGGSGASMRAFAEMITQMATIDPTVAGLASVHGCIGAVDPVQSFGSVEQKVRFLPKLADGRRLSAFALTEPNAGSDLTALRTHAELDMDEYVVNGEKLFITNAAPGRTIGLVCLIDGKPSVLVVDLPKQTNDHFQIKQYGIYALRRAHNVGLVFKDFRVPVENLLRPGDQRDGLTIAYHGLNLGRVSLCANAAGAMRWMLAEMLPWGEYRQTYGQAIDRRELVRRRIGRMAGLIVACDALTAWCAGLLDQGYRGEMECIIAKIFGSESQKEAAIELLMKTHGGRSFLEGHLFGDNVHDFLAPCIYEGEGEMLGMAFLKSLIKQHGKDYFEPIGRTLGELGVQKPNPLNPRHAWALRSPLSRYAWWNVRQRVTPARWTPYRSKHRNLNRHVHYAQNALSRCGMSISSKMTKYQLTLADRQCRMSAMSAEVQNAVVMLVTGLYASRSSDDVTKAAADAMCRELRRRIEGSKPSDDDFRQVTHLGEQISQSGWRELTGVTAGGILMRY